MRLDVPFHDLTAREKDIVLHGAETFRHVAITTKTGRVLQGNLRYENARDAVLHSLDTASSDKARQRLAKFITVHGCPDCHGTRVRPAVLTSVLTGQNIAQISALTLTELAGWAPGLPDALPSQLHDLATRLTKEFLRGIGPLLHLGLGYLTLDRAGSHCPQGNGNASSSPPPSRRAPPECCTCWTSPRSACTPPTCKA